MRSPSPSSSPGVSGSSMAWATSTSSPSSRPPPASSAATLPVTQQERWEENPGYSPSTLAAVISGLVCAADLARAHGSTDVADSFLGYADWIESHLDEWTTTENGCLLRGRKAPLRPHHAARPRRAVSQRFHPGRDPPHRQPRSGRERRLRSPRGYRWRLPRTRPLRHPPRRRSAHDRLPQGHRPCPQDRNPQRCLLASLQPRRLRAGQGWRPLHLLWARVAPGRCLAANGPTTSLPWATTSQSFITAFEKFSSIGGMLPEQVWDYADMPEEGLFLGFSAGSAQPLVWAHAEYLKLLRSVADNKIFDTLSVVEERYAKKPPTAPSPVTSKSSESLASSTKSRQARLSVSTTTANSASPGRPTTGPPYSTSTQPPSGVPSTRPASLPPRARPAKSPSPSTSQTKIAGSVATTISPSSRRPTLFQTPSPPRPHRPTAPRTSRWPPTSRSRRQPSRLKRPPQESPQRKRAHKPLLFHASGLCFIR